MKTFLQTLKSLFHSGSPRKVETDALERVLEQSFRRITGEDPRTNQQWQRLQHAMDEKPVRLLPGKRPFLKPRPVMAVAVAIAAAGVYVLLTVINPAAERFSTLRGEQKAIVLSDGSHVTLNYATDLLVSRMREGEARRLTMSGEAYFRVKKSDSPFIVSTRFADVKVIGTEFNLCEREGLLEVGVVEGIVHVFVSIGAGDSTLQLTKRQRAIVPENGFPRRMEDVSSSEYPGWIHGKLVLDRTSFLEASREIEMRFDVTIRIQDQDLRSRRISGILDAKTAESAVTALCELTGRKFRHDGQMYTLY